MMLFFHLILVQNILCI